MRHPWQIWSLFACCTLTAMAAVGWLSVKAWQSDRAEAQARRQAAIEENARLALWRMDSAMAPLIAQESARPDFTYQPFYATQHTGPLPGERIIRDNLAFPSPLLVPGPPEIRLHFQFNSDGTLRSPRVPLGSERERALENVLDEQQLRQAEQLLAYLQHLINFETLQTRLPEPESVASGTILAEPIAPTELPPQHDLPLSQQQQASRGMSEFQARSRTITQNSAVMLNNSLQGNTGLVPQNARDLDQFINPGILNLDIHGNIDGNLEGVIGSFDALHAAATVMTPLWIEDELLLARRVNTNGREVVQGCWLDWPVIKQLLLATIDDLLPHGDLQPVAAADFPEQSRMLAALPVILHPGEQVDTLDADLSPLRISLLLTWGGLLIAVLAVGGLLQGVISLSERRAAFVSAVTHELRTPLTTFRMYAEMLAEEMVADGEQRRHYLKTLRTEADRLMHLVENVLAYARLERGGTRCRTRPVTVEQLLSEATQRLDERALAADFRLMVNVDDTLLPRQVHADPSAVEQVLFNLVDNACKYADTASDRTLHLEFEADANRLSLRLRDHGPGVSDRDLARLFQPFRKSARDAAHSAPGVGLGLAISRRLARDMRGDLQYHSHPQAGACFSLTLPIAER